MEYQDIFFCITWFFGGFFVGLTGLGASMLAVPVLAGSIAPTTLFPVATFVAFIINLYMGWIYRKKFDYSLTIKLILGAVPGAFAGVALLLFFRAQHIQLLAGIVLLLFVLLQIIREKFHMIEREETFFKTVCCAFFAGVLNSSVGVGGPPLAAYAIYLGWSPQRSISMFVMSGIITILFGCIIQFSAGFYTDEVIHLGLLGGLFSMIGITFGTPLVKILPLILFKRILLMIIAFGGVTCIWHGLA